MKLEFLAKPVVSTLLASVTFVDGVETTVKILSGLAAVCVALLQWLSYKSRKRLEDEQLRQLKQKANEGK